MRLLHQLLSLGTRGLNVAFLRGEANYTTSARAYREAALNGGAWVYLRRFIDWLFGAGHCEQVWQGRVDRARQTLDDDARIRIRGAMNG